MLHTPSPVTESCTLSLHDALPISGGLEVSALHNHFFFDEPKVYFMHIGGRGEPEKLAAAVKGVWDAIKKVRAEDRKSTRLNSSHRCISYAVFCLKKKNFIDHRRLS